MTEKTKLDSKQSDVDKLAYKLDKKIEGFAKILKLA